MLGYNFANQLFPLKNRIDPGGLYILLQLHPTWIAAQHGSKNIHGLITRISGKPSMSGSFAYADAKWCSMPLDKGCGVQRFKHVKHQHDPPREIDEPVTDKVPGKGAGVEVRWGSAGQGRTEGDVEE